MSVEEAKAGLFIDFPQMLRGDIAPRRLYGYV